jgi:hypothetical protein
MPSVVFCSVLFVDDISILIFKVSQKFAVQLPLSDPLNNNNWCIAALKYGMKKNAI